MTDSMITANGGGLSKHLEMSARNLFQKIADRSKNINSHQKMKIGSIWTIEHWRGKNLLATRIEENLIPNQFINHVLDVALSAGTQITAWYIALFSDNHTPAAGDTYAVPGFTESTEYDEATRPLWSDGGVSGQQVSNSASKATFTMTGVDGTIYGAAMVSDNTKGDQAASGAVLGPVAQFTQGPMTGIIDDDVIKVYATIIGSDGS